MEVHPVGRVVFVYFLLKDKQMTNRGDGKLKGLKERSQKINHKKRETSVESSSCVRTDVGVCSFFGKGGRGTAEI